MNGIGNEMSVMRVRAKLLFDVFDAGIRKFARR